MSLIDSASALRAMQLRFDAVIDNTYDGIVAIDDQQMIVWVNQSALEMFHYSRDGLLNQPIHTLLPERFHSFHPGYVQSFRDAEVQSRPMYARAPVMGLRRDGREFPCEISITKVEQADGVEMMAVIRDVSVQSRLRDELARAGSVDSLSGLINGEGLEPWLEDQLARCQCFDEPFGLVLFELDRIDLLTEQLGRSAVDQWVVVMAAQLKEQFELPDRLARLSDERFVLLLPRYGAEQTLVAAQRVHRLVDDTDVLLPTGDHVSMTATVGVVGVIPQNATADILARSENALDILMRRVENEVRLLELN